LTYQNIHLIFFVIVAATLWALWKSVPGLGGSMKAQRWYEIEDGKLCVYNQPDKKKAAGCSVTRIEDLGFYRRSFDLQKVWEVTL